MSLAGTGSAGDGWPAGRFLALFVAAAFVVVTVAFLALILSPRQSGGVAWPAVGLAAVYLVGAGLLASGALLWFGAKAWVLRWGGLLMLLVASVVNVSFAFMLVPLVFPGFFSLGLHQAGRAGRRRLFAPGDAVLALGAFWLVLSTFYPYWFHYLIETENNSRSYFVGLWDGSGSIALAIVLTAALAVLFSFMSALLRRWDSLGAAVWRGAAGGALLSSSVAVALAVYLAVALPGVEGVSRVGNGPGSYLSLAGAALLGLGAAIKLRETWPPSMANPKRPHLSTSLPPA